MSTDFRYAGASLQRGSHPIRVDPRMTLGLTLLLQLAAFLTPFPSVVFYLVLPFLCFALLGRAPHRVLWSSRFFLVLVTLIVLLRGMDGVVYAVRLSTAFYAARLLTYVTPNGDLGAAFAWYLRPLGRARAANAALYASLTLRFLSQLYSTGTELRDGIRARGGQLRRHPARIVAAYGTGLVFKALRCSAESAAALHARGYSGTQPPLRRFTTQDWLITLLFVSIIVAPLLLSFP
ncbi:MAG: hypothetical protein EA428_07020 [Spirochaetaceae bacterium]|nr:MAG: hypothetical protein EA428_07020 [Spirochaetaceae bacterium]